MPAPTIDDVRPILRDFELRIRKVLEDSWTEDWLAIPERLRALMDATTRANCVFSFARHRAIAEFSGDRDIKVQTHGRTVKFFFRDRALVRLKKANPKSGLASNIPTQATLQYIDPQLPLLELPEIYHVDILYHEDSLVTRIQSIAATCRQGWQKLWSYELEQPANTATITPFPSPAPSGSPPPATVRPRTEVEKPLHDKE